MRDAIVFKLLAINIALKLSEPDDGLLTPNWTNPKIHEPVKITKKKQNILWISQKRIKYIR